MPKISVIVPVFKVENYIEKCARCLFLQTMEDMEFIFIDDCSPDKSIEVLLNTLENFPHRKSQTRIVKLSSNSGQAAVRRKGIQLATGDYLICCDSDDWIDIDLYEKLYKAIIDHNADIALCDMVDVYKNKTILHKNRELPISTKDAIKNLYRHYFHLSTANKLIKRSILEEYNILPYEGINMWEDNGYMYRVFYYADKLVQVRGTYYYYNRCNDTSITINYREDAVDQMILCAIYLTDFFRSKSDSNDYEKCIQFIQYLAKINLITTKFSGIKKFESTFPETRSLPKGYDKCAFSFRGKVRLFFVEHYLSWLFILLFKVNRLMRNNE